jgi:hypothetical protein
LAESSDFLPDVPYFVYGIYYLVMISLVFFGTYPTFMSYDIMIYPAIHIYMEYVMYINNIYIYTYIYIYNILPK